MPHYRATIDAPVPVADAFDHLARFSSTQEWDPGVAEARDLTPDPVRLGSRFEVVAVVAGRRIPLVYEITAFDRPHQVRLRAENGSTVSEDTITFTPWSASGPAPTPVPEAPPARPVRPVRGHHRHLRRRAPPEGAAPVGRTDHGSRAPAHRRARRRRPARRPARPRVGAGLTVAPRTPEPRGEPHPGPSTSTAPITLDEAAERLGVHYMTAYRYVRTGQLPAHKEGVEWRVEPADVEALAAAHRQRRTGRATSPSAPGGAARGPAASGRRRADHRRRLVDRLAAGDEAGSWSIVQSAVANGIEPAELYIDVLTPALRTIGDRWVRGELSVADEHQASVVVSRIIGRLGPRFTRPGRSRGTVVLGAAPGDQHGLPSALFADLLRGAGFTVADLGADTPVASFVDAARDAERLVAVGVTVTTPGNQDAVADTIRALREVTDVPIVVGGHGLDSPDQASALGADHWTTDARQALALFDELDSQARRERRRRAARGRAAESARCRARCRCRGWPVSTPPALAATVDAGLEATIVASFSRIGYQVRDRVWGWTDLTERPMDGRVVLVTGATSGLGGRPPSAWRRWVPPCTCWGATAPGPSRPGPTSPSSAATPRSRSAWPTWGGLDDVARFADDLKSRFDRLDAIVHNAGALVHEHRRTDDGIELTVQTHVVAPFALTARLADLLARTPGSRVVTVSSGGMYTERLEVDRLEMGADRFDGVTAYARAKRAQVVLNEQWASGWDRPGSPSTPCTRAGSTHPAWPRPCPASTGSWAPGCAARSRVPTPWCGWRPLGSPWPPTGASGWTGAPVGPTSCPGPRSSAAEADRLWDWACEPGRRRAAPLGARSIAAEPRAGHPTRLTAPA